MISRDRSIEYADDTRRIMDEMIIAMGPFPPRYLRTYMLTSVEIIENISNDPVSTSRGNNLILAHGLYSIGYPIFPDCNEIGVRNRDRSGSSSDWPASGKILLPLLPTPCQKNEVIKW